MLKGQTTVAYLRPGPERSRFSLELCEKDQQINLEKRFGKIFIDIKASKCHIIFFRLLSVVTIVSYYHKEMIENTSAPQDIS